MTRPRLLDLFCGAGGAAKGYQAAGFYVVGVDIAPQPNYCGDEFHLADALTFELDGYDVIHASPPCQGYSALRCLPWIKDIEYPMLLAPMWRRLAEHGAPWIIENVERAPMAHSTVLCGWTFGLPFYRHRRFGSSFLILAPPHRRHELVIHAGHHNLATRYRQGGGRDIAGLFPGADLADAGLDHMTQAEASQAIPPAYTEHIGAQLLDAMRVSPNDGSRP
jgi:DNA (cytosine-5)-methyltransferase 1